MTAIACPACLYPDCGELHTCGIAVAFPAEANTSGARLEIIPEMDHFFGEPEEGVPGVDERYCTEPRIPNSKVTRTYHTKFEMLEHGDFRCSHCGQHFLEDDASASS